MDVILMVLYVSIVLGVLVFIHEGGHYLAARAFGVRVTEFMIGLPGPHIGFKRGETTFGITVIPLGGYAKVCGMEAGKENPHIQATLAYMYKHGTADAEDVAEALGVSLDDALEVLWVLVDWGSIVGPLKSDKYNTFRTTGVKQSSRGIDYVQGEPREFESPEVLYESERSQTYRALPFWKRSVVLLAGIAVNLIFAIVVILMVYSIFGFDYTNEAGVVTHITIPPLDALQAGFVYIIAVVQAVIGLFNPSTVMDTVSNSTSVVGMAVLSKEYADAGFLMFILFCAMLSVSLGIMNLLPIPPLDGGRFVIEIFQKLTHKTVSCKVMNIMTMIGMTLFIGFFIFMLNQDIQRFVFDSW